MSEFRCLRCGGSASDTFFLGHTKKCSFWKAYSAVDDLQKRANGTRRKQVSSILQLLQSIFVVPKKTKTTETETK